MMKWIRSLLNLRKNGDGKLLPQATPSLNQCYAKIDKANWWQGDVFPTTVFNSEDIPNTKIPFWMLTNRTCHLYSGVDRTPKLPYLNLAAVQRLGEFVNYTKGKKSIF